MFGVSPGKRSRTSRLVGLLMLTGLLAASCSSSQITTQTSASPDATSAPISTAPTTVPLPVAGGGDVIIATGTEPSSLDPHAVDEGPMFMINGNIFEALLDRAPNGELIPALAVDLGTQVDETTWRFALREGVVFHNGEPFNAASVVASIERVIDPEFGSQLMPSIGTIVGAEAVDEYSVDIFTNGPDPILPSRLGLIFMVPAEASAEPGFAEAPIGTGPYEFVRWERGSEIVLKANEAYWGGRPIVDTATFRFLPESGTRLAALLAGDVDLIVGLTPEDFGRVPQAFASDGVEHIAIELNARSESPIADVRVRRALNYAIDRQAIVDNLFLGLAKVDSGQFLSPSWFGFDPDLEPYPYDPDLARSLIEEAGATGLTIELFGLSGRILKDRETLEAVAGFWKAIGLEVDLKIVDFSDFIQRFIDRENRPTSILVVHDNPLFDADRTFSGYYHMEGMASSNDDAEVAAWIDDARTELDSDRRASLYHQVLQRAYDEAWFVTLVSPQNTYGASEGLEWTPRVDGDIRVITMALRP